MNGRTDNERLLADVLGPEFGAALLDETLRHVRWRRQWRHARRLGGVLGLLAMIGIAVWPKTPARLARKEIPIRTVTPVAPYQLVRSQPLSPGQIVTTSPGAAMPPVVSAPALKIVVTVRGGYLEVGDDELIALAAPHVVALVRHSAQEVELVFLPEPRETDSPRN